MKGETGEAVGNFVVSLVIRPMRYRPGVGHFWHPVCSLLESIGVCTFRQSNLSEVIHGCATPRPVMRRRKLTIERAPGPCV